MARVEPAAGCRAALRLYRLAADRLGPLLDLHQAAVVDLACTVAARA
ncbi:hypothetical protein [Glycomyces halotolerans]